MFSLYNPANVIHQSATRQPDDLLFYFIVLKNNHKTESEMTIRCWKI